MTGDDSSAETPAEFAKRSEMETMTSRRNILKAGAMAAIAGALPPSVAFADPWPTNKIRRPHLLA